MSGKPLRVGIIGANAERGWAHDAHIPALAKLPRFQVTAVSSRLSDVAEAAAKAWGAQHVFKNSLELAKSPEVDIVTVCVRVPQHFDIVTAALDAGKDMFCEWPLGRTVEEAKIMAAKEAKSKGARIIGLQGIGSPAIRRAAEIVRSGALGRVLSARLLAPSAGWGPVTIPSYIYLNDKEYGATLTTIGAGHAIGMIVRVLGKITEIQARGTIQHPKVKVIGTDQIVDRNCFDHLAFIGIHESGCVTSLEAASSRPMDSEFLFDITGTSGELRIKGAAGGGIQTANLTLEGTVDFEPPAPFVTDVPQPGANVAELYTMLADKIDGQPTEAPNFAEALDLHRLLTMIEHASDTRRCEQVTY